MSISMLNSSKNEECQFVNLILWRHAEAEDTMPDMNRPLTEKGLRQAKLMAAWLKPRLPRAVRILSSPAIRAKQTADALDMEYTVVREMAPGADAARLLAAAGWPLEGENVLVVGHQPTLGYAASLLIAGEESGFGLNPFGIKKGAIFWISHRQRDEQAQNVVRAVLSPDMLKE